MLIEACVAGNLEEAKRLLAQGADVNAKGSEGITVKFLVAVYEDEPEELEVKFTLEDGAWLLN